MSGGSQHRFAPVGPHLVEMLDSVAGLYQSWVGTWIQARGMSAARVRVLTRLHFDGPQPMNHLAHKLGVSPRNVTGLVAALEEDGLATRERNPSDKRSTLVSATEDGGKLIRTLQEDHTAAVQQLLVDLPPEACQYLTAGLHVLQDKLRRAHADYPDTYAS